MLFQLDRRSVITPHGHRGMQWAHLVVQGRLRAPLLGFEESARRHASR